MRISPKDVSRFDISLCRMLEIEFTHGYCLSAPIFYISIYNEKGEERSMMDEDKSNWGPHWTSVNKEFEDKLDSNPHL